MKPLIVTALAGSAVVASVEAVQRISFDGTVTIGTLLAVAGAVTVVVTTVVSVVGAKFFPTKGEMASFRSGIGESIATLRQDVHNLVGAADGVAKREATGLEKFASERHVRLTEDIKRLEKAVEQALVHSRAAEKVAEGAAHDVDRIERRSPTKELP